MMMLNISGQPLDENMLRAISLMPGINEYVPLEYVKDEYIKLMQITADMLFEKLVSSHYEDAVFYHTRMCQIQDMLEDIHAIKCFQQIYSDIYSEVLEVGKDD